MRGTAPFGTSPTSSIGGRDDKGLFRMRTRTVELVLQRPEDFFDGSSEYEETIIHSLPLNGASW